MAACVFVLKLKTLSRKFTRSFYCLWRWNWGVRRYLVWGIPVAAIMETVLVVAVIRGWHWTGVFWMQVTRIVWKRHVVLGWGGGGVYLAVTHIQCYTDTSDCSSPQVFVLVWTTSLILTPPPPPLAPCSCPTEHLIYILTFSRLYKRTFWLRGRHCFIVKCLHVLIL